MDRKAQFFIISTVIITVTLVAIQGFFSGYGAADTSDPGSFPEDYIFNNVKSEFVQTYENYDCPDTERNLIEYDERVVNYYGGRRIEVVIDYDDPCDSSNVKQTIDVNLNMTSFNGHIRDSFTLTP